MDTIIRADCGLFDDTGSQRKFSSEVKLEVIEWYFLGALFNKVQNSVQGLLTSESDSHSLSLGKRDCF